MWFRAEQLWALRWSAMNAWRILVVVSYVVGSFPTALFVGKLTGNDPRTEGSGNPGASNMYRVAGRRAGAAVLLGDVLKGFVPAAIGFLADGRSLGLACGLAAMVGHILPLARTPRVGGKGVATLGGVCWFLYPLVTVGLIAIWVLTLRIFRTASVGSLAMAAALPFGVALRGRPAWEVAAMAGGAVVIFIRHWSNIKRIARNEERRVAG